MQLIQKENFLIWKTFSKQKKNLCKNGILSTQKLSQERGKSQGKWFRFFVGVFENFMKIVTTFFQGTFRIQFTILIIIRAVLTNQSREVIGKNRDFPLKSHLGHSNDLKFQDSSMLCSRGMEILDLVTVHGFAQKKSHKFCHKREKGSKFQIFCATNLMDLDFKQIIAKM